MLLIRILSFICLSSLHTHTDTDYISANTLLMTFVVKNHVNEADNELAEAWEKVYLDFLKNYTGRYIHISYTAEVSNSHL